jgi:hypothetical protein
MAMSPALASAQVYLQPSQQAQQPWTAGKRWRLQAWLLSLQHRPSDSAKVNQGHVTVLLLVCQYSHILSDMSVYGHILHVGIRSQSRHSSKIDNTELVWVCQVAERRQVAAPPGAAAASATPPSQQQVTLPDLSFPTAAPANPEASYKAALEPLSVSDFDSSATGAYNR